MWWEWFTNYWSSVGLGAAIVLAVLAFGTDVLRADAGVSRWRDPAWLGWAGVLAYLLHNFEEYGVDAAGRAFEFPTTACTTFGFTDISGCPLTPGFFVAVNIPFVWITLVALAVLARRTPVFGLVGAGLLLTNALSHLATLFTPMGYSSGTLTAAVLFVPLSLWIFGTQFGRGKQRIAMLVVIVLQAALAQVALLAILTGLSAGVIPMWAAALIQTTVPIVFLIGGVALAARRWPPDRGGQDEAPAVRHDLAFRN